jgi:hypothetical protein
VAKGRGDEHDDDQSHDRTLNLRLGHCGSVVDARLAAFRIDAWTTTWQLSNRPATVQC